MKGSCPSMMVVFAGGSKGNGRIQSRELPLKIHDSGRMLLQGPILLYRWTDGARLDYNYFYCYCCYLLWQLFNLVNGDVVTTSQGHN